MKRFGNAPETETETETETEQYPPTPDGGDVGVLGHLPTDSENTGTGPKRHTHTEPMVNSYFGIWNRLGLPEFRKLLLNVPNHGELLEALSYYAPTEVIAAVEAYATVQSDPAYSMAFRYQTVVSFLIKGLESFAPGARPLEVYRAKAPGPASRENSSADQVADIVAQAEEIARRNREVAV